MKKRLAQILRQLARRLDPPRPDPRVTTTAGNPNVTVYYRYPPGSDITNPHFGI